MMNGSSIGNLTIGGLVLTRGIKYTKKQKQSYWKSGRQNHMLIQGGIKRCSDPLEHEYRLMAFGEEQKRMMLTAQNATTKNNQLRGSGCYWQMTHKTCLNQ